MRDKKQLTGRISNLPDVLKNSLAALFVVTFLAASAIVTFEAARIFVNGAQVEVEHNVSLVPPEP